MVGAGAAVPEGVLGGEHADVVGDGALERGHVVGAGLVDRLHHLDDAEGEEEDVGASGVPGPQPALHLHGVDEPALRRVDAAARPVVEHRRLAFLVQAAAEPPILIPS